LKLVLAQGLLLHRAGEGPADTALVLAAADSAAPAVVQSSLLQLQLHRSRQTALHVLPLLLALH
jgi:hypothetical protein